MNADQQRWIRINETPKRWHAIYTESGGSYVTWCGQFWPVSGSDLTTDPVAKCAGCLSKLRHPYLVPDQIQRLREPKYMPAPATEPGGLL
jgi:hypothetical protein